MDLSSKRHIARAVSVALLLTATAVAGEAPKNPSPPPTALEQQLLQQQLRIAELERILKEQALLLQQLQQQLTGQGNGGHPPSAASSPAPAPVPAPQTEVTPAQEINRISGEVDALAEHNKELNEKVSKLEKNNQELGKSVTDKTKGLGNFSFSGDVRLRYEPFVQGGGFATRQRERVRARLNIVGKLSDEISGGISVATGSLDDVNSTNQTLTGFFTRKTVGFDRYYLTYRPRWFSSLTLTGGKTVYPWYRTPLTFDSDINPEGFSQTFTFNFQSPILKTITLVGFELPFNEASGGYDSAILGGQIQTRLKLSERVGLRLYAAGVNVNRADPIAVAVANGTLRPSLPNTNRFRTNSTGAVIGYASKFLYLDLIAAVDLNVNPRWPLVLQFNVVNNTRAMDSERTGYWGEVLMGRLSEPKDVQFGYALVRLEREAVIGAFNESDLRAATNVHNHRFSLGYQAFKNVSVQYTLWLGRLANPHDPTSASQVPPNFRTACSTAPFAGCQDPSLKRMQFDVVYKF